MRFAFALAAIFLCSAPADAADLVFKSQVAKSVENDVTVWRGAVRKEPAAKAQADSNCRKTVIFIEHVGYPQRRLRTHRLLSRENFDAAFTLTTTGFFADRIAAGL